MIKKHNLTGLKYLCKTERDDWDVYLGSGVQWKKHLKKYGNDITTELLFESNDVDEFKKIALEYSNKLNIVDSKEFANLILEQGDGGDTVSGMIWITNGIEEKRIERDSEIESSWYRGRSPAKCVFSNVDNQKKFSNIAHKSEKYFNARQRAIEKFKETRKIKKWKGPKTVHSEEGLRKIRETSLSYPNKGYCDDCKKYFNNLATHYGKSKIHRNKNK